MIDKEKQYRTRDGREVRIYATDGGGAYAVHGAIREPTGWFSTCWLDSGDYLKIGGGNDDDDLIEIDCEEGHFDE